MYGHISVCIQARAWMEAVRHNFTENFGKPASPKMTILRWEHKLFFTGSIKDKSSTERPSTRRDTCTVVEASVLRSQKKSLRKGSSELRIPKITMLTHMTKGLYLKSFQPTFNNELSDNDMDKRHLLAHPVGRQAAARSP